jgi:hypothetical protein
MKNDKKKNIKIYMTRVLIILNFLAAVRSGTKDRPSRFE